MEDYIYGMWVVPSEMREALDAYVKRGVPLGDFLRSVVSNDLMEACGRADMHNLPNIPAFAAYVYNEMPAQCHGSLAAYDRWLGKEFPE